MALTRVSGNLIASGVTLTTPVLGVATATSLTASTPIGTASGGTGLGGATPFTSGGVVFASSTSVLATGSALTFDGTNLNVTGIITANGTGTSNFTSTATSPVQINGTSIPTLTINNSTASVETQIRSTTTEGLIRTATNHPLVFATNATERARIDTSGNVGIGVTPSAWRGTDVALQIRRSCLWDDNSNVLFLGQNVFENASGNYVYIGSDFATIYSQLNGKHEWSTAASGTAGDTISFTQAMTLDASGQLTVGASTPILTSTYIGKLSVYTAGGANFVVSGASNTTNTVMSRIVGVNQNNGNSGNEGSNEFQGITSIETALVTSNSNVSGDSGGYLMFKTKAQAGALTERARIDSSGNLLVGTTAQIAGATCRMVVDYATGDFVARFRNTNASPFGLYLQYSAVINNTSSEFLYCEGSTGVRLGIRSNGGIANYSANDANLSDRREKTNFAPATSYLDKICAIPVQTFNYIDQDMEDDGGLTLGVVAQDVQAVAPELVMESNWASKDEEPKMRLSIYQTDLQYALMKALQELKAEFDAYKASHP